MLYNAVRTIYRRYWVIPKTQAVYKNLSLQETFARVYREREWSSPANADFDSGSGSSGPCAERYSRRVIEFIQTHNIKSVADLGCGDFRIGKQITSQSDTRYVGVDIVPSLIARNIATFGSARISFTCANLATDLLPKADLCLIRQVLQHLSNAEIERVLNNISHYQFALISEHVPKVPKSFNRDKPHGPDVRAFFASGVYLEKPPFSRNATLAWEDQLEADSLLRTVLIQLP